MAGVKAAAGPLASQDGGEEPNRAVIEDTVAAAICANFKDLVLIERRAESAPARVV